MSGQEYIQELKDTESRLRADMEQAVDEYNLFVDQFYYNTLDGITKVVNEFNLAIFEEDSGREYIDTVLDSPDYMADRLTGRDYSEATISWEHLQELAAQFDKIHGYVKQLKRSLEALDVAYIDYDGRTLQ